MIVGNHLVAVKNSKKNYFHFWGITANLLPLSTLNSLGLLGRMPVIIIVMNRNLLCPYSILVSATASQRSVVARSWLLVWDCFYYAE